ncbi:MAG TPA: hypothetical protein VEO00_02175 [Actinomycetota bacterium]|nr:hypothetical protein [Actinomycetota bacterium]
MRDRIPAHGAARGRTDDRILVADGRRISPWRVSLGRLPDDVAMVRRYRVTQRAATEFLVEVVWHERRSVGFAERLRDLYSEAVGALVRVEVRELDALPPRQAAHDPLPGALMLADRWRWRRTAV